MRLYRIEVRYIAMADGMRENISDTQSIIGTEV